MAGQVKTWVKQATRTLCALTALTCVSELRGQVPCRYEITSVLDLPDCPFGLNNGIDAYGISPNGRYVAGATANCTKNNKPCVYDITNGQIIPIPLPPGFTDGAALDVNDAGLAVGWLGGPANSPGFVFDIIHGHYVVLIHSEIEFGECWIKAINQSGEVCGNRRFSGAPDWLMSAFTWSIRTGMIDFGPYDGQWTVATDLNDAGNFCGWYGNPSSPMALLYEDGRTTELGPAPNATHSSASCMNNRGQLIAGSAGAGYVWQDGSFLPMPCFGAPFDSGGPGFLNDYGVIAGSCYNTEENLWKAAVWIDSQPRAVDQLLTPGSQFVMRNPQAVAQDGSILMWATDLRDATNVALVLRPVFSIAGDANCNDRVDMDDILNVITAWGPCLGCRADLNGDQSVNAQDLVLVITNWDYNR